MHLQNEDCYGNPIGVRSGYVEGKRCEETLVFGRYRQHVGRINNARIFNAYGPRMHLNDGRAVSNFIIQALQGSPITVYDDGTQTRSFCYVDGMVEAFLATGGEVVGPLSLGNPGEFTMLQLAETVIDICNTTSFINFKLLPADDPWQRGPDISKAEKILNWKPKVPLREGLTRTVSHFDRLIRDARLQA